ncbi:MAG: tyrosine-type recombinase/integrase [Halopseudomonas sp.]
MATFTKQASGSWQAQVKGGGARKSKTFKTKAEAKIWAKKTELDFEAAQDLDMIHDYHTVGDLFRRYADEIAPKKKGAVSEGKRLVRFQTYDLANLRLAVLRRKDIEDWIELRLKSVRSSSVNRELNLLSHCFTTARRWNWMDRNPMQDLERPKDPPHRDRLISELEIKTILLALGYNEDCVPVKQNQFTGCAFLFAIETALRAGEICNISPGDIHLKDRYVHIADTKNGFARDVPLSKRAIFR